jgi:hypothetical protein
MDFELLTKKGISCQKENYANMASSKDLISLFFKLFVSVFVTLWLNS